jgi:hypothetical protein
MSSAARIRIAALATALFIGALTATGIAVRADHRQQTAVAPTAAASNPAPSADVQSSVPTLTFGELEDD